MHLQLVEQFPQPLDHCLALEGPRQFSYPKPAANRGEGLLIKLFAAALSSGKIGSRDCCQIISAIPGRGPETVQSWTVESSTGHPSVWPAGLRVVSFCCVSMTCNVRTSGAELATTLVMDIARPEFKLQKRKRQIAVSAVAVVVIAFVTVAVYRLRPAAPTVERGTVWTDSVKRGPMLRQVRGVGTLVPSQEAVLQIPAETEATVVRIRMLPGSLVKADSLLLEMSNPQVEQAAIDAQLQLKAAEAEYQSQRMTLESSLMNQKAGAATVQADYAQAQLQAQTDKALYDLGVISGLAYKASKGKSDELTTRNGSGGPKADQYSTSHRFATCRAAGQSRTDASSRPVKEEATGRPQGACRNRWRAG